MKDKYFVDSNVILYSFMKDTKKAAIAEKLMLNNYCIISSQVISEVCNNLTKISGFSSKELKQVIEVFYRDFTVISVEFEIYNKALEILKKYTFSFWDSLIVASAIVGGASIIYSEELKDESSVPKVKIVNPFRK